MKDISTMNFGEAYNFRFYGGGFFCVISQSGAILGIKRKSRYVHKCESC